MGDIEPLAEAQMRARLAALPAWELAQGAIARTFVFTDFVQAFGFMTQAAIVAERQNHHPEWSNVYKRVAVRLSTHEAGGITERDFTLAEAMDRIAERS